MFGISILDSDDIPFLILEEQSIGMVVPGASPDGKPHNVRFYSIASSRDGDRPHTNNLALTVKRESNGIASTICAICHRLATTMIAALFIGR